MEYNLESSLEKRLTLVATLTLVAVWPWFSGFQRGGQGRASVGVGAILVALAVAMLYARSLFEDCLRVDADSLVMVRRRGESTREIGKWKRSDVCEASLSKVSSESTTPRPTTLMLLLAGGQLLELTCPSALRPSLSLRSWE